MKCDLGVQHVVTPIRNTLRVLEISAYKRVQQDQAPSRLPQYLGGGDRHDGVPPLHRGRLVLRDHYSRRCFSGHVTVQADEHGPGMRGKCQDSSATGALDEG
jgi:hypothetical protein